LTHKLQFNTFLAHCNHSKYMIYLRYMKLIKIICAMLACTMVAVACAKPPTAEMNNAIEAVARAENDADAVLYAANTLARARDALDRMQREAESKRYDAAKTYAAEAVTTAERAIADGRAGAVRARTEAAALVDSLGPAIAETEQGISAARSARLGLDFPALNRELDRAKINTDLAKAALTDSRYNEALEKGRSAQAGLSDINRQLSDAVMASSRKK
jgi:HEPN domain-containing protein